MAKKTGGFLIAGANRAYSNRGSGKNKQDHGTSKSMGSVCTTQPIYDEYG